MRRLLFCFRPLVKHEDDRARKKLAAAAPLQLVHADSLPVLYEDTGSHVHQRTLMKAAACEKLLQCVHTAHEGMVADKTCSHAAQVATTNKSAAAGQCDKSPKTVFTPANGAFLLSHARCVHDRQQQGSGRNPSALPDQVTWMCTAVSSFDACSKSKAVQLSVVNAQLMDSPSIENQGSSLPLLRCQSTSAMGNISNTHNLTHLATIAAPDAHDVAAAAATLSQSPRNSCVRDTTWVQLGDVQDVGCVSRGKAAKGAAAVRSRPRPSTCPDQDPISPAGDGWAADLPVLTHISHVVDASVHVPDPYMMPLACADADPTCRCSPGSARRLHTRRGSAPPSVTLPPLLRPSYVDELLAGVTAIAPAMHTDQAELEGHTIQASAPLGHDSPDGLATLPAPTGGPAQRQRVRPTAVAAIQAGDFARLLDEELAEGGGGDVCESDLFVDVALLTTTTLFQPSVEQGLIHTPYGFNCPEAGAHTDAEPSADGTCGPSPPHVYHLPDGCEITADYLTLFNGEAAVEIAEDEFFVSKCEGSDPSSTAAISEAGLYF